MNNFNIKYEKILEILKQFETKSNFLNQIRRPRLSDIELIAVDLTAESLSIDSEYQLFRLLPSSLSSPLLPHDCIVWHTNPFNQNFFLFYFPRDTIARERGAP